MFIYHLSAGRPAGVTVRGVDGGGAAGAGPATCRAGVPSTSNGRLLLHAAPPHCVGVGAAMHGYGVLPLPSWHDPSGHAWRSSDLQPCHLVIVDITTTKKKCKLFLDFG